MIKILRRNKLIIVRLIWYFAYTHLIDYLWEGGCGRKRAVSFYRGESYEAWDMYIFDYSLTSVSKDHEDLGCIWNCETMTARLLLLKQQGRVTIPSTPLGLYINMQDRKIYSRITKMLLRHGIIKLVTHGDNHRNSRDFFSNSLYSTLAKKAFKHEFNLLFRQLNLVLRQSIGFL